MNIDLNNKALSEYEKQEVQKLLDSQNPTITDELEQIWYLLNRTWEEMGCDNKTLDWEKIGRFYAHPVWLLNGLFIESHDISMNIRQSITHYVAQKGFKHICDYGGGFGTLAREIAKACPDSMIEIYEPFPSEYGQKCIAQFPNISFVSTLQAERYDCLISTDVLEHVDDVLGTFHTMLASLKIDGEALIGNCFYPVIDCHLPKHFHFRYTFKYIAQQMGVKYLGDIQGAEYVQIYHKHERESLNFMIRAAGGGSKCLFILLNLLKPIIKRPLKFCLKLLRKN